MDTTSSHAHDHDHDDLGFRNSSPANVNLSKEEFKKLIDHRMEHITEEFDRGFEFLRGYDRTVSFFGSARFPEGSEHYETARKLARRLAEEGIGVVTGGGPGIMEAANRGAFEGGGSSLGLNVVLPHEQRENPYLTKSTTFKYFFIRKVMLTYAAEAYIVFPGGFGTLDELFEIITLVQTHKIERVPIILMGDGYWSKLNAFIHDELFEKKHAVNSEDMELYTITDDIEKAVEIVKNAPIRIQN